MTRKEEFVEQALHIVDYILVPADLRPRCCGGPGSLLERLFPAYRDVGQEVGVNPLKIIQLSDAFVVGTIDRAQLREAIARLAEEPLWRKRRMNWCKKR